MASKAAGGSHPDTVVRAEEAVGNSPQEFWQVLRTDLEQWRKVLKATPIATD